MLSAECKVGKNSNSWRIRFCRPSSNLTAIKKDSKFQNSTKTTIKLEKYIECLVGKLSKRKKIQLS